MRILAVDDDDMVLELLKMGLIASGQQNVDTAGSAAQAIRQIDHARRPYDCVLLDIQMPGMDGIDLCAWIKDRDDYRDTPIIMVTAMSDRQYIQRAFNAGAIDYITKPFDALELASRIGMAQRLVRATFGRREASRGIATLRDRLDQGLRIPFDEAVTVHGLEGVIGYGAMQNYLERLSRSNLFATALVAFEAHGLEPLYNRVKPTDFYFLLTDTAEALVKALAGTESLIAYAGRGRFVVALKSAAGYSGDEIAQRADQRLRQSGALQGLEQAQVSFRAGAPVRFGLLFSGGVARALDSALAAPMSGGADRPSIIAAESRGFVV